MESQVWEKLYHEQCERTNAYAFAYGRLSGLLMMLTQYEEHLKKIEVELQEKLSK